MDVIESFLSSPIRILVVILVIVFSIYNVVKRSLKRYPYPLPPSPPAEPLFGHFRSLPLENAHLKHMAYAKQYSKIFADVVMRVTIDQAIRFRYCLLQCIGKPHDRLEQPKGSK